MNQVGKWKKGRDDAFASALSGSVLAVDVRVVDKRNTVSAPHPTPTPTPTPALPKKRHNYTQT